MATDLVDEFCTWSHNYNGISPARAASQRRLLTELVDSLPAGIDTMTARDLESFLSTRGATAQPATILKWVKMIRPFLRWLRKHRAIDAEAYLNLIEVSAPRGAGWGAPRPYSRTQIAEFWEYFDEQFPWTSDADEARQTAARAEMFVRRWQGGRSSWAKVYPYARRLQAEAITALALFGGLRLGEIHRLALEDAHYDNAFVRVNGARKNPGAESIERAVPMPKPLRAALANWIEFRAQVLQPEHDNLWLVLWRDDYLKPMSERRLGGLLFKVGDGYSLHRMRHTFATERLRANMRIEILQGLLGHADIKMTLRYADVGEEDVIREANLSNETFSGPLVRSHPVLLP